MAKVYVSSTVADLERERRAVVEWLVAAGHQPFHSNVPKSDTVRDSCLEDVDNCDLYVLIVGTGTGSSPQRTILRACRLPIWSSGALASPANRASPC
jgi:molybdopterin biosynthesis enzyme MoaB